MSKKVKLAFKILFLSPFIIVFGLYLLFAIYLTINENMAKDIKFVHDSIYAQSKKAHSIQIIDDGLVSLYKRIEMIESAKESIELEFFIYEIDLSSKIISNKLIEMAKKGIKIRLLVDFSQPIFKLKPAFAYEFQKHGIEIKYYNTASLFQLMSVQHRSHRKLLIIDGKSVLTGGRNIGDDYFNLSAKYNFLDSDIFISGEIVKNIQDSFNLYWNSEFAKTPDYKQIEAEQKKLALNFFEDSKSSEITKQLKKLNPISQNFICTDISFTTDFPGVLEKNRRVFKTITETLKEVEGELLVESPYFVIRHGGLDLLNYLQRQKIDTHILTNGLYSTDAYYTVSPLYTSLNELKKTKIHLYAYNGVKPKNVLELANMPTNKRWGIHAKRAVIDNKTILIGTYNIDPRSANLNSEILITCRNNEKLAQYLSSSIHARIKHSDLILGPNNKNSENLTKNAPFGQLVLFYLTMPLSKLFDFLL